MGMCYPQRILKTGKVQKSLCGKCTNHMKIKFIKINGFWSDDLMESAEQIERGKILTYNQGCKYLNLGRSNNYDKECIMITECSQFKIKIMKKTKKDPSGHGNNAINIITGRANYEMNRDGGNSCSNPNWGTGKKGDANPDTQKEKTAIQKYEEQISKQN